MGPLRDSDAVKRAAQRFVDYGGCAGAIDSYEIPDLDLEEIGEWVVPAAHISWAECHSLTPIEWHARFMGHMSAAIAVGIELGMEHLCDS